MSGREREGGALPERRDRFKQLVHCVMWHFQQHVPGASLGKVKLNKILWFIDVAHYRNTGESLSGASFFVKRKWGPVPPHILATLEDLELESTIVAADGSTGFGSATDGATYRVDPSACRVAKSPDYASCFSKQELEMIREKCKELANKSGGQLSRLSHDHVYDAYPMGGRIPLRAYLIKGFRRPNSAVWERLSLPERRDDGSG